MFGLFLACSGYSWSWHFVVLCGGQRCLEWRLASSVGLGSARIHPAVGVLSSKPAVLGLFHGRARYCCLRYSSTEGTVVSVFEGRGSRVKRGNTSVRKSWTDCLFLKLGSGCLLRVNSAKVAPFFALSTVDNLVLLRRLIAAVSGVYCRIREALYFLINSRRQKSGLRISEQFSSQWYKNTDRFGLPFRCLLILED